MIRTLLMTATLLTVAAPAFASETSWRDVTPKLEGCWTGTGFGGEVSECWIVHEDGRADGMFLLRRDGTPNFAEILTIDGFEDGPQMRLKHVNGDMTGWEEKDDYTKFDLVTADPDRLTFKGLALIFTGNETLRAELKMKMSDGEVKTVPFDFTRTATLNLPAED